MQAGPSPTHLFGGLPVQPAPGDVHCDGAATFDIPWLASWGLYPQVYALGRLLRPSTVLEIGTLYGHGLCAVLQGAGESVSSVEVIDNESYFAGGYLAAARQNIWSVLRGVNAARAQRELAPAKLRMWQWDMADGVPFTEQEQRRGFDLILVDGEHSYEGKRRDLTAAWDILAPGGHLYVDDVHSMPQVHQAVADFARTVLIASVLELFTRTVDRPRGAYLLEKTSERKVVVQTCGLD